MKRLLMDVTAFAVRVALVEEGELTELYVENKEGRDIVGNIYCGRIETVLPGMQAAFVDIGSDKNAYYYYGKERIKNDEGQNSQKPKAGTELLVQVEKPAIGEKGAVVTAHITFPGKFLVLIPNDYDIGISKKIKEEGERTRIKEIVAALLPQGYGAIVRTQGEGKSQEEYKKEFQTLYAACQRVLTTGVYQKAPYLVYEHGGLFQKAVRELFDDTIDEFLINQQAAYEAIQQIFNSYGLDKNKIKLYEQEISLFREYFIESQAEKALQKKVWLKSGGFLTIEQTEAMVVIDVNTGKYTGKRDLEKTLLKTNLEAAAEAAKQIRLRNLSGMIIIDFIDMYKESEKKRLRQELECALGKDRIKTVVIGMTELGLMQVTRKKTGPSLLEQLSMPCHCCHGLGRVLKSNFQEKHTGL